MYINLGSMFNIFLSNNKINIHIYQGTFRMVVASVLRLLPMYIRIFKLIIDGLVMFPNREIPP